VKLANYKSDFRAWRHVGFDPAVSPRILRRDRKRTNPRIPFVQIGRRFLYDVEELRTYLIIKKYGVDIRKSPTAFEGTYSLPKGSLRVPFENAESSRSAAEIDARIKKGVAEFEKRQKALREQRAREHAVGANPIMASPACDTK